MANKNTVLMLTLNSVSPAELYELRKNLSPWRYSRKRVFRVEGGDKYEIPLRQSLVNVSAKRPKGSEMYSVAIKVNVAIECYMNQEAAQGSIGLLLAPRVALERLLETLASFGLLPEGRDASVSAN